MTIATLLVCVVPVLGSPGPAARVQTPRDVIATAWHHPFVTDADVLLYQTDTRGLLRCDGGDVLIRYPGIEAIVLDGGQTPVARVGPNLGRIELPSGVHEIALQVAEPFPDAACTVTTPEPTASTPDQFNGMASSLQQGDELVIADGVYRDWQIRIDARGTADRPIIVRPETPGGVIIQGSSRLTVSGRYVIVRGLRFENCGPHTVLFLNDAADCRVTQCQFFYCGNPRSTFGHITSVNVGCHHNRIDHCFFIGSKSMSLGQRVRAPNSVGKNNRFDHNIFRDIFRYWRNGQENIQLGQNQREFGDTTPQTTVEYNLFDHAWGDSEIISNKSSGNVITHNTAAHCPRSAFTLRGGNDVRFDGNVITDCRGGVIVMGKRHAIVNNLILDASAFGVRLDTGSKDSKMQVAADDALVAYNTIVNCPLGIYSRTPTEGRPHVPKRCRIFSNLLVGSAHQPVDLEHATDPSLRRNLYWPEPHPDAGSLGVEPIVADPSLIGDGLSLQPSEDGPAIDAAVPIDQVADDRWDHPRPHGPAPDIGADEIGAPSPKRLVSLPPIPPSPLLAPALYLGDLLCAQDEQHPLALLDGDNITAKAGAATITNGSAQLTRDLPADVVVNWQFQPQTWETAFALSLTDDAGEGYTLRWGGLADDGQPNCVFQLLDAASDMTLARGPDTLNFYREFRPGWGFRRAKPKPGPDWYDLMLLKHADRLYVLLERAGSADPGRPIILWNDHGRRRLGDYLQLRLQQTGTAQWRNLRAWHYQYTGDLVPPPPPDLSATPRGRGRVQLTWGDEAYCTAGYTFDISRSPELTQRAFEPIAGGLHTCGWDDFEAQPGRRYLYCVVARNALGLASPPAVIEATAGRDGPVYHLINADHVANIDPPLRVMTPKDGRSFLWAPAGSGNHTEAPPPDGRATYRFDVHKPGRYAVFGLVHAPDSGTDSFYAAIDDASFRTWHTGRHPGWGWSAIKDAIDLKAGPHSITLKHRETGTRLTAILITDDLDFEPLIAPGH